jgi:hypothetical protein
MARCRGRDVEDDTSPIHEQDHQHLAPAVRCATTPSNTRTEMEVTVRPMEPAQLPQAYWLGDAQLARLGWLLHTPYATTWCVRVFDELVGVAGLVHHGSSILVDLVAFHPDEPRDRIVAPLMHHVWAYADACGQACQIVYAPASEAGFWEPYGFRATDELHTYAYGSFLQAQSDFVVPAAPEHWLAITHQDRHASGEDRSRWLREHDYLNMVHLERGRVRGFLMSLLRNALIVADSPEVGLELQRWQFPIQEHLIVPAANTAAVEHLTERGYTNRSSYIRMVRGTVPPWRPERIFALP